MALITKTYTPVANKPIDPNKLNTNLDIVISEINGNIDNQNVVDDCFTKPKIKNEEIGPEKIKGCLDSGSMTWNSIPPTGTRKFIDTAKDAYDITHAATTIIKSIWAPAVINPKGYTNKLIVLGDVVRVPTNDDAYYYGAIALEFPNKVILDQFTIHGNTTANSTVNCYMYSHNGLSDSVLLGTANMTGVQTSVVVNLSSAVADNDTYSYFMIVAIKVNGSGDETLEGLLYKIKFEYKRNSLGEI